MEAWPFSGSLMLGFIADYAGGDLVIDENEIEDAQWFCLDSLPALPNKMSIGYWLIDSLCS